MIRLRLLPLFAVLLFAACAKPGAPPTNYKEIEVTNGGTISGTVKFNGPKPPANSIIVEKDQDACGTSHPNTSAPGLGDGIANAIVYLDTVMTGRPFGAAPIVTKLDQLRCEFVPHLQIVRTGTHIVVSNSDKVIHNFHLFLNGKTVVNEVEPDGAPPHEITLTETGLNYVICDVHPWMRGFVMVTSHPYYALTDSNGRYSLTNVPPGRYTLKMWRDNWAIDQPKNANGMVSGYNWGSDYRNQREVVVEAGKVDTADFVLP